MAIPIPNISAGGGGPTSAQQGGGNGSGGGFDSSGWVINFGGQQSATTGSTPKSVAYAADSYGLPNLMAMQPLGQTASQAVSRAQTSPYLLVGLAIGAVVLLKKKG